MSVLLIGDVDRAEFRDVRPMLDAAGRVVHVPDIGAAVGVLGSARFSPEMIVLAQSHPGQFNDADVDRLRQLAPLSRILGLLGSWCEGEMRSGLPLSGVVRIYWHQWQARWLRELDRLRRGRCPTWGLPPTAIEEDRLLLEAEDPWPARTGLVVVFARLPRMADFLAAACQSVGYSTVSLHPSWDAQVSGAVAALFDVTEGHDDLPRLARRLAPVPIIALFDFPRIEDRSQALAAGAAGVLSKPLLLDDLYWELDRVTENDQLRRFGVDG